MSGPFTFSDFDGDLFLGGNDDGMWLCNVNELEILQSTGLTDKNGKEIFEGDVVRWGVHVGEVRWQVNGFVFATEGFGLSPCNLTSEVIGNIYENPDLLPSS